MQSFTPSAGEVGRSWLVGILHNRGDARFAWAIVKLLAARGDIVVGNNEPSVHRLHHSDPGLPAQSALRRVRNPPGSAFRRARAFTMGQAHRANVAPSGISRSAPLNVVNHSVSCPR